MTDLDELEPDGWLGSWCAQCGPDVRVDEDGCCLACGIDAVGHGADEACRARVRADRADRAEAELKALREAVQRSREVMVMQFEDMDPRGPLTNASEMPATRLELRWRPAEGDEQEGGHNWACDYHLVLELDCLDIRAEVYDDSGEMTGRVREKLLTLGGCRSSRQSSPFDRLHGKIDTPFRDGAHIRWDGRRLGLRMFVVCGDDAQELLPLREGGAAAMTAEREEKARAK